MKYGELLKKLNAYDVVFENISEQDIYDIKIETDGKLKIVLDNTRLEIPIT